MCLRIGGFAGSFFFLVLSFGVCQQFKFQFEVKSNGGDAAVLAWLSANANAYLGGEVPQAIGWSQKGQWRRDRMNDTTIMYTSTYCVKTDRETRYFEMKMTYDGQLRIASAEQLKYLSWPRICIW